MHWDVGIGQLDGRMFVSNIYLCFLNREPYAYTPYVYNDVGQCVQLQHILTNCRHSRSLVHPELLALRTVSCCPCRTMVPRQPTGQQRHKTAPPRPPRGPGGRAARTHLIPHTLSCRRSDQTCTRPRSLNFAQTSIAPSWDDTVCLTNTCFDSIKFR
jgi:hypothetical protein